ncbi:uncharacterized protein Triagg1_3802 [Trichoderma aggressivum f. europaeum]|uniref:Uncharacterized protein n=1 Tax=Trichoderma aggressivum f. europaeum TaxID=173218 RepID=A0AAE1JCJ7_9HYPO|nr:hypothetical protein Triagg1_3802 [Trichoderma aggressivum f. europaeum]
MPQNTQPSCTSNEPRQNSLSEHHGGPLSPTDSVYEVARRAVDFLDVHKTQDTAPGINGPQLVAATTHLGELRARERCNIMRTPPASHSSAQTSPSSNGTAHELATTTPELATLQWATPKVKVSGSSTTGDAQAFSDIYAAGCESTNPRRSRATGGLQSSNDSKSSTPSTPRSGFPIGQDFTTRDTSTLRDGSTSGASFTVIHGTTEHGKCTAASEMAAYISETHPSTIYVTAASDFTAGDPRDKQRAWSPSQKRSAAQKRSFPSAPT